MSVDPMTLAEFSGKQVILHVLQDDGTVAELEGKVEDASEVGMAFKEKGKRDVDLVFPDKIEEIALAPSKPKTISQKKLKPAVESTVRQHLADRHGWLRSEINKLSDEDAFAQHENLDHDDLGHKHVAADDDADENGDAGESSED